jgi:hypothetical protein
MSLRSFLAERRDARSRRANPAGASRTAVGGGEASDLVARATTLEAEGKFVDAVDALTQANRLRRDPELERRLVGLRHRAYREVRRSKGASSWPVIAPRDHVVDDDFPVISPDELSPETLSTGILRHGGLHIRRLVPDDQVARLVDGIDRAMWGYDVHASGQGSSETNPWYEPFEPEPEYSAAVMRKRRWVRDSSGVWTADSPRVLSDLVDTIDLAGLGGAINAYFGERPVLSVNKCTLRRVQLDTTNADWHQDGAFLGDGIRSVNVWMSLSHCGRDAPGLDIVPARIDHIVETGTEGATFPWAVGPGVVERVAAETPVIRPIFEPGDVLVFDDLFLHRTAVDSAMTRPRYAIETWFFAPSVYPGGQIPLVF